MNIFQRVAAAAGMGVLVATTAASPVQAFGHKGNQEVKLAVYVKAFETMPESPTKQQLLGLAQLIKGYAVACQNSATHTDVLEAQLNGMMIDLEQAASEAGVALPREQIAGPTDTLTR